MHSVPHAEHVEKMVKQDELKDFDDVRESSYFMPDQYLYPYCSEVHSNRRSILPVEGPNTSGTFKKAHLW